MLDKVYIRIVHRSSKAKFIFIVISIQVTDKFVVND